jgi:prolyl-tRNA synthetase
MRVGEKFADADLIGIPYRVVVSDKTFAAGTYECKARRSADAEQLSQAELLKTLGVDA